MCVGKNTWAISYLPMSAIKNISHVLMLDAVIYVKPSPMHWQLTQTGSCLWWQRPIAQIEPSPMHLYSLPIPMGSGKTHWKSTSMQYSFVQLKSRRSCSLDTVPWNPSRPLDPFTHNCPPVLYLGEVENNLGTNTNLNFLIDVQSVNFEAFHFVLGLKNLSQ